MCSKQCRKIFKNSTLFFLWFNIFVVYLQYKNKENKKHLKKLVYIKFYDYLCGIKK